MKWQAKSKFMRGVFGVKMHAEFEFLVIFNIELPDFATKLKQRHTPIEINLAYRNSGLINPDT